MQDEDDTARSERAATLAKASRLREKASECRSLAASAQLRGSRESYHRLASSYEELAGLLDPGAETAVERAAAVEFEALLFADEGMPGEDGSSTGQGGPRVARRAAT